MAKDETPSIAEVVWVQKANNQNHIYYASFNGEQWEQRKSPIYSSDNFLTTATISSKSRGQKLLIWTEQRKNRAILMKMDGDWAKSEANDSANPPSNRIVWSDPEEFTKFQRENFAASIVVDAKQRFWVFWSSTSATQSDIFMMRETDNDWGPIEQVNSENAVPDYHPQANNDINENIYVEWTSYDLSARQYTRQAASFSPDGRELNPDPAAQVETSKSHEANEQNLAKIKTPDFLPTDSRIMIHFPSNTLVQSTVR